MSVSHKTLTEIAQHIGAELHGDATLTISAIAALTTAVTGELSFIVDKKHLDALNASQASAVIVSPELASGWTGNALIVPDPYLGYAKAAELFKKTANTPIGIHPSAIIGQNCKIDTNVSIGANVVLDNNVIVNQATIIGANTVIGENCTIGTRCELKANVTLCDSVNIGEDCIIHSGTVIGCDGFGNAQENGHWYKIPQLGGVHIGNNVEIGANTTIDRGALGDTIIENGVRIDNLVQIAHNVFIGAHTAIAACCGIAGSTSIGKYCMLAGQVGINGHLTITDNVILMGKAMVTNSISQPGIYASGTGLMEASAWRKNVVHFRHLDKLAKKIKQLEKL